MSLFFIEGRQLLWHINICAAKPQSSALLQPRPTLICVARSELLNATVTQVSAVRTIRTVSALHENPRHNANNYYVGLMMVLYMASQTSHCVMQTLRQCCTPQS